MTVGIERVPQLAPVGGGPVLAWYARVIDEPGIPSRCRAYLWWSHGNPLWGHHLPSQG